MYILQSLQGHLYVVQSLISFLNNSCDAASLIASRTNSQIFGASEDMVSVPKYTEWLLLLFRVELFFRLQDFSQNEIYLSWWQALDHFLPYKFLLLIVLDFLGGYSLFQLFKVGLQKKGWFYFYKQVLKLFIESSDFIVQSPTMEYPINPFMHNVVKWPNML